MILRSAALEGSDLYSWGTPAAIGQGLKRKSASVYGTSYLSELWLVKEATEKFSGFVEGVSGG